MTLFNYSEFDFGLGVNSEWITPSQSMSPKEKSTRGLGVKHSEFPSEPGGDRVDVSLGTRFHPARDSELEIADLRSAMAEDSRERAAIDQKLAPASAAEQAARSAILTTLPWRPGERSRRSEHYRKLYELAVEFGAVRSRRRFLTSQIKNAERKIAQLEKEVARGKAKAGN